MSSPKSIRIMVVYEVLEASRPDSDFEWMRGQDDWRDEYQVASSLQKLGHDVRMVGVYNEIDSLIAEIKEWQPHLVFNLLEAFDNDRDMEANLVAMLELLGVPYTGVNSRGLNLCKDKALSKLLLASHEVLVPRFAVSVQKKPMTEIPEELGMPVIVKPLGFEGSEGIHQCSVASNPKEALKRILYLHEKYETDVIIEQFIPGHDLYVGLIGQSRIQALAPVELKFKHSSENLTLAVPDNYRIASFKAKWDKDYQKRHGIERIYTADAAIIRKAQAAAKNIFEILELSGYARIDFRLSEEGELYFIEANPNPAINDQDEFALSAKKSGIDHIDLIAEIVKLGLRTA